MTDLQAAVMAFHEGAEGMTITFHHEIDRLRQENEKLKSEIETYEKLWERHDRELAKWKSTVEEYRSALTLVERERNYWQEMATKGGENG